VKDFLSRPWMAPVKWAIAALAVWLVFHKVSLPNLWPSLAKADYRFLVLTVLSQLLVAVLNALRWKVMLRAPGLGLGKYLYFVFVGSFFNLFLPSAVAAEAVKVVAFGRKYGDIESNIGITLFARGLGALVQVVSGAAALLWMGGDLRRHGMFERLKFGTGLGVAAVCIVFAGVFLAWRFRSYLLGRKWMVAMLAVGRDPVRAAQTTIITIGIQLLSSAGGYCLFRSVYPSPDFFQVMLFLLIIQAVLMIPFSMGGVGVREYLNLLFFSDIGGMPPEATFAANMLGYIPLFFMAAVGGGWILFRRWKEKQSVDAGGKPQGA
jgi:uncharacterized membrane protein YbhN (UPF0104 family)